MNTYVTGATIKQLRENQNMTQAELAETIGVSSKTISKWETGKGLPDITLLQPLAQALGISIIDQSETAGLGAVCAATTSAGEAFRNQFIGMSGVLAVTKDGGEVDAITSATITSRAVTVGVNAALKCVANFG